MAKVDAKISMKQSLKLHLWAAKVWWNIEPKLFISSGSSALVESVTPYVTIWLSARIIDELAGPRDPEQLWKWVLITVLTTALLSILNICLKHWKQAVHSVEDKYEDRLLNQKLLDMDYANVEATSTRDILFEMKYHLSGNAYGFIKIHSWYFGMLIDGITSIAGALALCVSLFTQPVPASAGTLTALNHPLAVTVLILLLTASILLSPALTAKANTYFIKSWPLINMHNRYLGAFHGMGDRQDRQLDVRIYEQHTILKEIMLQQNYGRKGFEVYRMRRGPLALYSAAGSMIGTVLLGVIYLFVCTKAWAGAFGIGSATQYVGAITALCGGITELVTLAMDLPTNAAYLDSIRCYLNIPNHMYQGSLTTEKRSDRNYEVEFKDVSFKYPGSDTYALRHVNMKFRIGNRLAVVGMNGSGKTTFIKLLCRLYDPTEGQILLNNIDIRKYRYDDYINIFSVVFQDFQLLSLPLGQNVAASDKYDPDRVTDCLTKAGFADRLKSMSKGLDTWLYKDLDKEGVDISGGEAQKIAIARTLYKDAPFLILDEPTAALDPLAEAEVYSKFNDIAGDKTVIYISHRLSSCKFCDEIAVFHEGAVIQQGSHDELVAGEAGKYYELWHAQAQYYTSGNM